MANNYKKFWDKQNPSHLLDYDKVKARLIYDEIIGNIDDCNIVLEYGCGAGRFLDFLKRLHPNKILHGVDFSEKMVRLCKKRFKKCKNIGILQNNGLDLKSLQNNHYDFIYSITVFQHMPNAYTIVSILNEIHRVLKPKCRAFIQFSYSEPTCVESDGDQLHGYRMRPAQLRRLMRETNIKKYALKRTRYMEKNSWVVLKVTK